MMRKVTTRELQLLEIKTENKSEQYLSRVVYFDYPVRMTREDQHEHDDVLRSFLLK